MTELFLYKPLSTLAVEIFLRGKVYKHILNKFYFGLNARKASMFQAKLMLCFTRPARGARCSMDGFSFWVCEGGLGGIL